MQIPFGFLSGEDVELQEFYQNDSTTWFKPTGAKVTLSDRREVETKNRKHEGRCYDTGEYISQVGTVMGELLLDAPEGTALVVFDYTTGAGTRTYYEEVTAKYYQ